MQTQNKILRVPYTILLHRDGIALFAVGMVFMHGDQNECTVSITVSFSPIICC